MEEDEEGGRLSPSVADDEEEEEEEGSGVPSKAALLAARLRATAHRFLRDLGRVLAITLLALAGERPTESTQLLLLCQRPVMKCGRVGHVVVHSD